MSYSVTGARLPTGEGIFAERRESRTSSLVRRCPVELFSEQITAVMCVAMHHLNAAPEVAMDRPAPAVLYGDFASWSWLS